MPVATKKKVAKKTKIALTKSPVKHWYVIQVAPGQEAYATRQLKRLAKKINTRHTKYIGRIITPKSKELTVKQIPQYNTEEYEEYERLEPTLLNVGSTVLRKRERKIPTGNHYQRRIVARPKDMPGYLIVQLLVNDNVIEQVNEKLPGIIGLLPKRPPRPKCATYEECTTEAQMIEFEAWKYWKPIPLTRKEMTPILQKERDKRRKTETIRVPYQIGDNVRINSGAFAGTIGTVIGIDDLGMIDVRVIMLGRETKVRYSVWQLKAV